MKTRHILAIGLLTTLALSILGIAVYTNKNQKAQPTNADKETIIWNHTYNLKTKNQNESNYYETSTIIEYLCHQYIDVEGQYHEDYKFRQTSTLTTYRTAFTENNYNYSYTATSNETITSEKTLPNKLEFPFQTIVNIQGSNITATYNPSINNSIIEWRFFIHIIVGELITDINTTFYNIIPTPTANTAIKASMITAYSTTTSNPQAVVSTGTSPIINYKLQDIQSYADGYYDTATKVYNIGHTDGYEEGEEDGYAEGYNDSEAFNHPVEIAPLMMTILTMPFTFIEQAFNVTLWPGTQYQINIGNFIKALIAISAILFIIRLFTTGFSIIGNYTSNHQNNKLTKAKIKETNSRTALNNRTDPNKKK